MSKEFSKFCKCGGKPEIIGSSVPEFSPIHAEAIGLQQKELEVMIFNFLVMQRPTEISYLCLHSCFLGCNNLLIPPTHVACKIKLHGNKMPS